MNGELPLVFLVAISVLISPHASKAEILVLDLGIRSSPATDCDARVGVGRIAARVEAVARRTGDEGGEIHRVPRQVSYAVRAVPKGDREEKVPHPGGIRFGEAGERGQGEGFASIGDGDGSEIDPASEFSGRVRTVPNHVITPKAVDVGGHGFRPVIGGGRVRGGNVLMGSENEGMHGQNRGSVHGFVEMDLHRRKGVHRNGRHRSRVRQEGDVASLELGISRLVER